MDRHENRILTSWRRNARAWTNAVRANAIASRARVTDRAVIGAVLDCGPRAVIDLGCGEGWLVRELAARGIRARGVDGVIELVETAREAGGRFEHATFADLAGAEEPWSEDVAVCNFSLIGESDAGKAFHAVRHRLAPGGSLVVQTLHPRTARGDTPCADGWRDGSWQGFPADFTDPAPWYFRTLESWQALIAAHGLVLVETREPADPETGVPASIIFIVRLP